MNFKEALIAHLQGEKVECHHDTWPAEVWREVEHEFASIRIEHLPHQGFDLHYKFRLAPRTITVNGVEVPAPEDVELQEGTEYYVSTVERENTYYLEGKWDGHPLDRFWLNRGLVYLRKEDAIARAKAMLLTQSN